ncbi:MAG TPA: NAD(P) transhydrogenase subunit alpha [Bacteroidales bacterium]|nr:NAD(P) transhydrogenase subunit alpha [Bacteroidales bacterium]
MIIGFLKEKAPERRVAVSPETAKSLLAMKTQIYMESGAGEEACMFDNDYVKAGVKIATRSEVLASSDCILSVHGILPGEFDIWGNGKILVGHLNILGNLPLLDKLITYKTTSFSLDLLPRTTIAQSMDVLSSMATVSGYKAVLDAAMHLPRFFPMFMTASGTIKPARVLILGAGVAGLQALATSRRLGAVVDVFDVRSAVKEEVQSLGGRFIEVPGAVEKREAGGYAVEQQEEYRKLQSKMIHNYAIKADVIICTAQVPGKKAPVLITEETVESMLPGSVIVDLSAPNGGNCALTVNNSIITHNEVVIIGKVNYPSWISMDASRMFSTNLTNFARLLIDTEGNPAPDWNDEIVKYTCLTHEGKIVNEKMIAAFKE